MWWNIHISQLDVSLDSHWSLTHSQDAMTKIKVRLWSSLGWEIELNWIGDLGRWWEENLARKLLTTLKGRTQSSRTIKRHQKPLNSKRLEIRIAIKYWHGKQHRQHQPKIPFFVSNFVHICMENLATMMLFSML